MRKIKSLPLFLRPREKLLKYGAGALTTEELLSVILVTGTRSVSVSKLAKKINQALKKKIDLTNLGIGKSKLAQILASLELSDRFKLKKLAKITTAEQIYAQSQEIINSERESLMCFFLNARGELLKKEIVAVGKLNNLNILPREIFLLTKDLPVSDIILVHNHPSGDLDPSDIDIVFTKRVHLAGQIIGIKLLDHLIVTPAGWAKIKF